MRDWPKTLRRASYKGAPFWVERESPEIGRRVAVNEVSGGEAPVTEDMGRLATMVTVIAYQLGDGADRSGRVLEAACASPGAGPLVLPMDRSRLMHAVSCRRDRHRDRMGYVAYALDFVEAGAGGLAAAGIGALKLAFEAGAGAAAAALAGL